MMQKMKARIQEQILRDKAPTLNGQPISWCRIRRGRLQYQVGAEWIDASGTVLNEKADKS